MSNHTTWSEYYDFLFEELGDPRINNWFLMKGPGLGLIILSLYLYFVISWGPKYMKNRKPFDLNKTLIVYNFVQVLLSTWMVVEFLDAAWLHYNWTCQPVDYSNTPEAIRVARVVYIYFLAKITELLDTIFFVLRKKDKQITFLHLYHHTSMPMISWVAMKYFPGGQITFICLINSFVHIIMYTYYLLAAMGPQYQKYLWWKKYITTLQLVCIRLYIVYNFGGSQEYLGNYDEDYVSAVFLSSMQVSIAFLHNSQLLFVDCGYPKYTIFITLPNSVFLYYLFNDFYKMAYKTNEAKQIYPKELNSESTNSCNIDSNTSKCNANKEIYHTKSQ